MNNNNQTGFNRVLNTLDVLVVAFGAMIGWGWVVASGQWILSGGALGTALGFVIGGLMIFVVGYNVFMSFSNMKNNFIN